jgi:hypothetical protein
MEPSQPKQQEALLSTEGSARSSQPLQLQKMLHQEPAIPTQLEAAVSDANKTGAATATTTTSTPAATKSPNGNIDTLGLGSGQTRPYRGFVSKRNIDKD